jgi:hypothetical protein
MYTLVTEYINGHRISTSDQEYRELNISNLKVKKLKEPIKPGVHGFYENKELHRSPHIKVSMPKVFHNIIGEGGIDIIGNELKGFMAQLFGVDQSVFKMVARYNVKILHEKMDRLTYSPASVYVCMIDLLSTSIDFNFRLDNIITKRVSQNLVSACPEIIRESTDQKSKIEMIDKATVVKLVNLFILKKMERYAVDGCYFDKILKLPFDINSTHFGDVSIPVFNNVLFGRWSNPDARFEFVTLNDLNMRVNREFIIKYLTTIFKEDFILRKKIRIYVDGDALHIITMGKSCEAMYTERDILLKSMLLCECVVCGERVVFQNTITMGEESTDGEKKVICTNCAIAGQKGRVETNDISRIIPCFNYCNEGENNVLVKMYRSGIAFQGMSIRLFEFSEQSLHNDRVRGVAFIKYIIEELHPIFLKSLEVGAEAEPVDDNIVTMVQLLKSRYDEMIVLCREMMDAANCEDFIKSSIITPFMDYLTGADFIWLRGDISLDNMVDKVQFMAAVKGVGVIMRSLFMILYPESDRHSTSTYTEDAAGIVLNTANITASAYEHKLQKLINIAESMRCTCYCDHCKTIVSKNDTTLWDCDTGKCARCKNIICLEHGTLLQPLSGEERTRCSFSNENGSVCHAWFHNPIYAESLDEIPIRFITDCSCGMVPAVSHN